MLSEKHNTVKGAGFTYRVMVKASADCRYLPRKNIPIKFLENILLHLKKHGVLESKRKG